MKNIIYIVLTCLLILPVHSQVKEKIDELNDKCRLVRGHAHMIQKMIDEDGYNEAVVRAHHGMINTNLWEMEFILREIETLLTSAQKARVTREMEELNQLCNDTKPMVSTMRDEIDSESPNIQRIRILAIRINRNLRSAMEINNTLLNKL